MSEGEEKAVILLHQDKAEARKYQDDVVMELLIIYHRTICGKAHPLRSVVDARRIQSLKAF